MIFIGENDVHNDDDDDDDDDKDAEDDNNEFKYDYQDDHAHT